MPTHGLRQLATWPDLGEAEPSCDIGRALASAHGEIAHFHSDRDVDVPPQREPSGGSRNAELLAHVNLQ
ncbi:luciferase family protein [Streptomyces sp. NPDC006655]|uniref:luciferase family protein n=1 Tax=Streptomyces sp. NPDC006655 TaxID=3156898 RepID=UPI0034549420